MLTKIDNNTNEAFTTRERCLIKEILNDRRSPELSVARCSVKPGVITELHYLKATTETYIVEAGQGLMDDGECEPFIVNVGDCIQITANGKQRIRNVGANILEFLVICTPRFDRQCYFPVEG